MTDFPTLLYTVLQLVKSLPPLIYLKPEKDTSFGRSLPVWAIIGSTHTLGNSSLVFASFS